MDVDKEKIMSMHLMRGGKLEIDESPAQINDAMSKQLRHFIIAKGKTHIIELQVDRDADYDSYFRLQNQIVRAYRELRDAAAEKKYHKSFANLNEEQKEEITALFPQRIQETTNIN